MFMSESEIRTRYRQAKNQQEQVKILAELNLCDKSEILRIVNKTQEEVKPEKEQPKAAEPVTIIESKRVVIRKPKRRKPRQITTDRLPETVKNMLTNQLELIDKEIINLQKQLEEKQEQYRDIANVLIQ